MEIHQRALSRKWPTCTFDLKKFALARYRTGRENRFRERQEAVVWEMMKAWPMVVATETGGLIWGTKFYGVKSIAVGGLDNGIRSRRWVLDFWLDCWCHSWKKKIFWKRVTSKVLGLRLKWLWDIKKDTE